MIENLQPVALLGLFGRIQESCGAQKPGRTLLINPGSEDSEGLPKGVVVRLDE
jgi:Icc-related predicted phosphoesterase